MNIVMVGPFGLRVRGTISARALPLARALVRRGHRVVLVLPPWDSPADAGRSWEDAGVCIRHLSLAGVRVARSSPLLAWRLVREVWKEHPDLVHAFKPIGYAGLAGMCAWMGGRRRPVVVWDLDDLEGRAGWGKVVSRSPLEAWLRDWQERWALRHTDGLTVASHYLQDMAISAGVPAERAHVVLNGCELDECAAHTPAWAVARAQAKVRYHVEVESPVVLWATRFHEAPPERVCRILQRIMAVRPDARIWVAGAEIPVSHSAGGAKTSPGGLHARFRACCSEAVRERLRELGWLPAPAWRDAVLAADVGILPLDDTPINRARCPAKIPAMMAWGLPLIAHAVGEVASYIRDGESGRLIRPGDDEGFAGAVVDVLEDPSLRERLSREAGHVAITQWHWDRQALLVEKAYEAAWRAGEPLG